MLFAPKERGSVIIEIMLIIAIIAMAYLIVAWWFCFWPYSTVQCRPASL